MKRSRAAVLLMMSAVPLVLTACGATDAEQVREGLYTSIDACVADTNDRATCSEALAQAQTNEADASRRFATQEECVAAFGADSCESRRDSNGHSFFGPMMTGFFLSQMMRSGQMAGLAGSPAYKDRAGRWERPNTNPKGGIYRQGAGGAASGFTQVTTPPNRAVTMSRSGFGSKSSARGAGS
ncbi:MAG: DUF1190 domain-containing protein [Dokdonella sp.]